MSLPIDICRCLGTTCGSERIGCRRFEDRNTDPLRTPWACALRRADLPASEPCPARLPAPTEVSP